MENTKFIPVQKVWDFELWGVELNGLIRALNIVQDSLCDYDELPADEIEAGNAIISAMFRMKNEFDNILQSAISSAVDMSGESKAS